MRSPWPATADELVVLQAELAGAPAAPWLPPAARAVGGCFVCFRARPPWPDLAFAAAVNLGGERTRDEAVVSGEAGAPYMPGLLALREGAILEAAVRALRSRPDVLLVNATGRDHPRRAGLALHLGAVLELPTVGVTHRPLLATGAEPGAERGARTPLLLDGEVVGCWLRTRRGARPLAVHAAWRTDPDVAAEVVLASTGNARTAGPLRRARQLAREARGRGSAPIAPGPVS